eukprot:1326294-Alexandrium_andersonii.AAC.1
MLADSDPPPGGCGGVSANGSGGERSDAPEAHAPGRACGPRLRTARRQMQRGSRPWQRAPRAQ